MGVVLGARWEKKCSFGSPSTTHTHNTHIHTLNMVRRFPYPGGGNVLLTCVCALAEGVHKR